MLGPSAVTATVCSLCAARAPVAVRSVQPSGVVRVVVGAVARSASARSRSPARRAVACPCRGGLRWARAGPRAWCGRCRGRRGRPAGRSRRRGPSSPIAWPTSPRVLPGRAAAMPAASAASRRRDQRGVLGASGVPTTKLRAASPHQPRRTAPKSTRDQVAVGEHLVVRDAVHDGVVDADAQHGRERGRRPVRVVVEERRGRAVPASTSAATRSRSAVECRARRASTTARSASATTAPAVGHRVDLGSGLQLDHLCDLRHM